MPELPEVETVAAKLRDAISGLTIRSVEVLDAKLSHLSSEPSLIGAKIRSVVRHGKFLALNLNGGGVLLMHMMMSGRILVRSVDHPPDDYLRATFTLDRRLQVRFCDPRRFGTAKSISPREYEIFQSRLGMEPFSKGFTTKYLQRRFKHRSVAVKTALMNQSMVAGVGNIYADEALWRARLNPQLPAGELNRLQVTSLVRAVRRVLRDGLESGGTTFSRYANADGRPGTNQRNLNVFRRSGLPCPRCGALVVRKSIGGRSSHYCPACQQR